MNLFDLYAKLNLDSGEFEQGLDDAEKKTSSFGSKLKTGITGGAKVAAKAIGAVAGASTAMAGLLVKGAGSVSAYGDSIEKTSQKVGLSTDAYQEWDYVLKISGTEMANMTVGLKTLTNKLDDAKNGSEDAQAQFARLGLSMDDLSTMSREDIFSAVIEGFQSMEESTERAALANDLFGRSGQELTPLFNTSIKDTKALRKEAYALGGVMKNDAVKASAAYQDSLTALGTAFGGVKNNIISDMLPGLTDLANGFAELISGQAGAEESLKSGADAFVTSLSNSVDRMFEIGGTVVPLLISAIIENLPQFAESGVQLIESLLMAIIENLPQLIEAGIQIIQTIVTSLSENMPELVTAVIGAISQIALLLTDPETMGMLLTSLLEIIKVIAESIIENLPTLIDTTLQVLDNIVQFVLENLPMFIDTAVQIILALMDGFVQALPTLLGYLPEIITSIIDGLIGMLPQIVDAGVTLLTALVDNLPTIIRTITEKLPEIITSIVNKIVDSIPQIVDAGVTLLTALVDNLPEIITTIVGEIPRIINGIVDKLTDLIPDIVAMGFDLLVSLLDNLPQIIIELVSKLPEIITSIVDGLLEGVTDIWGVGKALIEGLWNGILSVGDWLKEKIGGFFSGVWSGIKSFFGIASPSKKFAWVGEMLDKGLVKGIDKYSDLAVDAATTMAEEVTDAANPNIDFTANAASSYGTGVAGAYGAGKSVTINVYGAEGQNVNELADIISQRLAFSYNQEEAVWA